MNAPHNGTGTSAAAAESMSQHTSRLCEEVLAFIRQAGNATYDEVVNALGMRPQTAAPRIREFVLRGRLYDTGSRRPTSSGRSARMYAAA
jgi:hypothetical protein